MACFYLVLLSLHSLYLIITVMTLGLKSHDLYGVPNEINDDDDEIKFQRIFFYNSSYLIVVSKFLQFFTI